MTMATANFMKQKTKKPERYYSAFYVNRLLDDIGRFSDFHKLIEIAEEQFNNPAPDLILRVQVLLDVYLSEAVPLLERIAETSRTLQNLSPAPHQQGNNCYPRGYQGDE